MYIQNKKDEERERKRKTGREKEREGERETNIKGNIIALYPWIFLSGICWLS